MARTKKAKRRAMHAQEYTSKGQRTGRARRALAEVIDYERLGVAPLQGEFSDTRVMADAQSYIAKLHGHPPSANPRAQSHFTNAYALMEQIPVVHLVNAKMPRPFINKYGGAINSRAIMQAATRYIKVLRSQQGAAAGHGARNIADEDTRESDGGGDDMDIGSEEYYDSKTHIETPDSDDDGNCPKTYGQDEQNDSDVPSVGQIEPEQAENPI
jgi:hypothetical protein